MIQPAFISGGTTGTWDQCNAYCPTSYPGATMFCVNNAAENEWIRSQYQSVYSFWIGYTDMPPYGGGKGTKQYGWVTGCSSTYTNWEEGKPDNRDNNQDYAALHPYGGQWNDMSTQEHQNCGCEVTPALTTTPSSRPSVVPSFRPTVAPSSGPTSSPTATPSFRASMGDVHE